MGLLNFLRRLFFPQPATESTETFPPREVEVPPPRGPRKSLYYQSLRRPSPAGRPREAPVEVEGPHPPYRFANFGIRQGTYFDLSGDGDNSRLAEFGLPPFHTPDELADWLGLPVGKLAWLTGRFFNDGRPQTIRQSHYNYRWVRKRSGGWRLIEAPKSTLKAAQQKILREILEKIPPHSSAHGFVAGRSIVTNAKPHTGSRVVVKFDLENFYPSVGFSRVVAIFRSVGYSREAAIWLAKLTTTRTTWNMPLPEGDSGAIVPYLARHLPQGAPTSPALANLSAYSLDLRLRGMARCFDATYTRYADDLTFSGPESLLRRLKFFIPLVTRIIRSERFRIKRQKRKVIRNNQRQTVTGVVVNERVNISRKDYDRLKAILTNCRRLGPSTQNRGGHADFSAYLRGRIAHVAHLNPARGEKLLSLYQQIDWNR